MARPMDYCKILIEKREANPNVSITFKDLAEFFKKEKACELESAAVLIQFANRFGAGPVPYKDIVALIREKSNWRAWWENHDSYFSTLNNSSITIEELLDLERGAKAGTGPVVVYENYDRTRDISFLETSRIYLGSGQSYVVFANLLGGTDCLVYDLAKNLTPHGRWVQIINMWPKDRSKILVFHPVDNFYLYLQRYIEIKKKKQNTTEYVNAYEFAHSNPNWLQEAFIKK